MKTLLVHVSPSVNTGSIRSKGLLRQCAKGKRKAVWLVRPDKAGWAASHVSLRHHVLVEETSLFMVEIDRFDLTTFRDGVFYVLRDIDPDEIIDYCPTEERLIDPYV